MNEVTTVGLDLAKKVFQVHGVDAEGTTVLRKQLRRAQVLAFFSRLPRCLVGVKACATACGTWHACRVAGHGRRDRRKIRSCAVRDQWSSFVHALSRGQRPRLRAPSPLAVWPHSLRGANNLNHAATWPQRARDLEADNTKNGLSRVMRCAPRAPAVRGSSGLEICP